MRSPISSPGNYYFNSMSFRNDERLLCMLNELIDRKRIEDSTFDLTRDWALASAVDIVFASILDELSELDRLFFRAEKSAMFHDILAEIIQVSLYPCLSQECLLIDRSIDYATIFPRYIEPLWVFGRFVEMLCPKSIIEWLIISASASEIEFAYNVLVSVVVLSFLYQYLIGYVDRGGAKTYNSGSFEFRATYVSLLLFQGAYVWIKFRDVAPKRSVYRRKDKFGRFYGKYEPRFKPPREKDVVTGTVLKFDYLPLGGYDTQQDAEAVCQIAGFYYGKDEGRVDLEDGSHFTIQHMSEQERSLCGEPKRKWVSVKVKEIYKELQKKKVERREPKEPRSSTLSANGDEQVDTRDSSSSGGQAVAFLPATANNDDEFVSFLSELAEDYDPMMSFDPGILFNVDDVLEFFQEGSEDIPIMQESLNQKLNLQKEQLEAEFNRRIAEQQQQHLHIQQRLEEQNLELRLENEHMKSILCQVLKPLRSHFATSTEI